LNSYTLISLLNGLLRNRELRFAVIHVTTRCNARCVDRCNIWSSKQIDMKYGDVCLTLNVLARNHFSVAYFTGGETGLYPNLVEALQYARSKGLFTSITTNGTISKDVLVQSSKNLDALSVSVDHYDERIWDGIKHFPGISKKAKETIKIARNSGINTYAITFLNPSWTTDDVEKVVHYVNDELEVPFAISYPYVSSNDGTYTVGGKLRESENYNKNMSNLISKVLDMKLNGAKIATSTCYLRDVIRAHHNLSQRYPCKAGRTILTIDCKLNVFPCYKKNKLFNLNNYQNLNLPALNSNACDNKNCMINCFKEVSVASKETGHKALVEELVSNPSFYMGMVH
jgi:MoaA/NifB/PqqE/SkfB family radical SAM enzyme